MRASTYSANCIFGGTTLSGLGNIFIGSWSWSSKTEAGTEGHKSQQRLRELHGELVIEV